MPRRKPAPRLAGEAARLAYEQAGPEHHVDPYERDETHAGRMATVPGRRGWFKVLAYEVGPTGAGWWALMGPRSKGDPGQATYVRDINLVPEKRAKRRAR